MLSYDRNCRAAGPVLEYGTLQSSCRITRQKDLRNAACEHKRCSHLLFLVFYVNIAFHIVYTFAAARMCAVAKGDRRRKDLPCHNSRKGTEARTRATKPSRLDAHG